MYKVPGTVEDVSRYCAQRLFDAVNARPGVVQGLVTGSHKVATVEQLYRGGVDEALPASPLKQHGNVTIVLNNAAAELLPARVDKNAG